VGRFDGNKGYNLPFVGTDQELANTLVEDGPHNQQLRTSEEKPDTAALREDPGEPSDGIETLEIWKPELEAVRALLLSTPLTEEFKWRSPCSSKASGGTITSTDAE